jgi:hypothetical protein
MFDYKLDMGSMFGIPTSFIAEYKKSIAQYPNIPPGEEFDGYPISAGDAK